MDKLIVVKYRVASPPSPHLLQTFSCSLREKYVVHYSPKYTPNIWRELYFKGRGIEFRWGLTSLFRPALLLDLRGDHSSSSSSIDDDDNDINHQGASIRVQAEAIASLPEYAQKNVTPDYV